MREPTTSVYRLDVFREPHEGDTWICRRDPAIRMPYAEIIRRTPDGIPYLTPEIALLFKAKGDRAKDQIDYERMEPLLTDTERGWLLTTVAAVHPGHPWLTG